MTRVLPLPGPARISTGPSVVVTAFFCGSLSPANKSLCSNIVISLQEKNILNPCYCITGRGNGVDRVCELSWHPQGVPLHFWSAHLMKCSGTPCGCQVEHAKDVFLR